MDHIRQFDWCSNTPDIYFLNEKDLDNCVTERILRNQYHDPLISSESEDEDCRKIDWDKIFENKRDNDKHARVFIPGLHPIQPYPKISALTSQQQFQCLKVLSQQNPYILPSYFMQRPTKTDLKVFEQVKETYEKEQKEYIEWVKNLWTTKHCIRALRPKPLVETVYEAEFKVTAHMMKSLPKTYHMVGQIPLDINNGNSELVHLQDLISVPLSELPELNYPHDIKSRLTIFKSFTVPEPCNKHPCKIIVPGEKSLSILPFVEIQRELAQYAADNEAKFIASENALRCLVENDRYWTVPVSVCQVFDVDGDKVNVVVLGNQFSIHKEPACLRTYRAFQHLLENALIIPSNDLGNDSNDDIQESLESSFNKSTDDAASSDDDCGLIIDTDDMTMDSKKTSPKATRKRTRQKRSESTNSDTNNKRIKIDELGIYSCTCEDSSSAKSQPRSFKKWQINDKTHKEVHNIIIHSAHKAKYDKKEVILEPIPEYQLDVGGSVQSKHTVNSLLLALMLRQQASVVNVRIEGASGDIITVEQLSSERLVAGSRESGARDVINAITSTLSQLAGLVPGQYLLRHEPPHGSNALLFASSAKKGESFTIEFDFSQLTEQDESKLAKHPPLIAPVMLPYHKYRRILPCAFTPYENQLIKEPRKPVTRQKTPPHAIKLFGATEDGASTSKWPKKKKRNRNNKKNAKK